MTDQSATPTTLRGVLLIRIDLHHHHVIIIVTSHSHSLDQTLDQTLPPVTRVPLEREATLLAHHHNRPKTLMQIARHTGAFGYGRCSEFGAECGPRATRNGER
eukprot:4199337-Pyramimonas_sp.AAC.1